MTILLSSTDIAGRREAAAGGLRALAVSLAADLGPVASRDVWLPPEKARLTRRGGWCPVDGTRLEFDPFAPLAHRCLRCGGTFTGDDHYRWWIVGYQLWLAERAVHGAVLALVAGDAASGAFADRVLDACAGAYLEYPNADNVLGPTRPFFSTYLESIWLLQLCVALSLREAAGVSETLASRVRERVIEPSAQVIASYDEGASNRQVWNNAALLAADALLGTERHTSAFDGPSGLLAHLDGGLLADGSWYEGENYHLFAHRGLWYGAVLAERRGWSLPDDATRRLDAGFVTPFLTALPDFTFPSRRDSAYAVSLRQWRFAELAELGVARAGPDAAPAELLGALRTLYDPALPRTSTERARSTAETERNAPASGLARSDLGWRSLLFARETLPVGEAWSPGSVLLPAQGIAVLRRDGGRVYAALDYGRSGGGHGHPDRLNVLLSDGGVRWQDDVGTGSYTEPTLHWYRSTLAHDAPLVDGREQRRVDGELLGWDEQSGFGLARAAARIDERVTCERTIVACDDYVLVDLSWRAERGEPTIDLPVHVNGAVRDVPAWTLASLGTGPDADAGFAFLTDVESVTLPAGRVVSIDARAAAHAAALWMVADAPAELWRALAPGPPGDPGARRMHALRVRGASGRIVQLWSLRERVAELRFVDDRLEVVRRDGAVDEHRVVGERWHVGKARGAVVLDRGAPPRHQHAPAVAPESHHPSAARTPTPLSLGSRPLVAALGEPHYRRSELSWVDAGRPSADVELTVERGLLVVRVEVRKPEPLHVPPPVDENPLDNEHPDTNADGVQLHLAVPDGRGGEAGATWLAVPAPPGPEARVIAFGAELGPVSVRWTPIAGGYRMRFEVALPAVVQTLALDVVINETSPSRERRRGQLVLSGGAGEHVYLRGARQPRDRFITFSIHD